MTASPARPSARPAPRPSGAGGQPLVWLLLGPKPGDNNQVLALAEGLGWPTVEKQLRYRRTELISNQALGPNLIGLKRAHCSPLTPPWPDLVITAGRRNEPVARWIKYRAPGRKQVRLVQLGRPWSLLRHFDLIITTPQYHLPHIANVLHNSLPLHRIQAKRLASKAEPWRKRLAGLPAPYTVLLVGGSSSNLLIDARTAARLLEQAQAMTEDSGGSLLISTSKRTPAAAIAALSAPLRVPGRFYAWRPDDPDNPYLAYLGLGDRFIVTGESVSMLTEACATGRPVSIFCPGKGADAGNPMPAAPTLSIRQRFNHFSNHYAPRRWHKDIRAIHDHLIDGGSAAWLGDPPTRPSARSASNDLARAVKRVQRLFVRGSGR